MDRSAFYITGGTLRHDAPSYVERKADLDLLDALVGGEFCYVLTSRQMGKSSLMVRTATKLREQGVLVVVLDLTAVGQNISLEQWYHGLLVRAGQQSSREDDLDKYWLFHRTISPVQRFFGAIQNILLNNSQSPVVIFVDEIDVVRSLPFSTDEFFAAIRECYNRRAEDKQFERLTFCLLGVATPSDLVRNTAITPFNIGRRIELHDFTQAEAGPLAAGQALDRHPQRTLSRILYWTSGHPYLTQRLCQAVADEHGSDRPAQRRKAVDQLCRQLFFSSRARDTNDNLVFVRERLRTEIDSAGLLQLYDRVLRGKTIPDDEADKLASLLKLSGVVRTRNEALVSRNRIYRKVFDRKWIRTNMPHAELRRQRAAFRLGVLRTGGIAACVITIMLVLIFQAQRQRQRANTLVEQINLQRAEEFFKADQAHEGVAYLASVLRENPNNGAAAERLISALTYRSFCLPLTAPLEHDDQVFLARFSPDSTKVVTVTARHTVRIWDPTKAAQLRTFAHQGPVNSIQFNSTGSLLLIASMDKTVSLWDLRTAGIPIRILKHTSPLLAAHFMTDGEHILTLSSDGASQIWGVASGELAVTPLQARAPLSDEWSDNGNTAVTASANKIARIWDLNSGEVGARLEHTEHITGEEISPLGDLVATLDGANHVLVWKVAGGSQVAQIQGHEGTIHSLRFSPEGKRLITASADGTARIWETQSGRLAAPPLRHSARVYFAAFSPEGSRVITASGDRTARIWDARTGSPVSEPMRHKGHVYSAEFNSEGTKIVTASEDKTVRVWEARPGSALGALISRGFSEDVLQDKPEKRLDQETGTEILVPNLKALVICRSLSEIKPEGLPDAMGIDISRAPDFLRGRDFEVVLRPYLGSGLSLKRIQELQQAVSTFAHSKGVPALDVFFPEQDSTAGVVQLGVLVGAKNSSSSIPASIRSSSSNAGDNVLGKLGEILPDDGQVRTKLGWTEQSGILTRYVGEYGGWIGRKPELMSEPSLDISPDGETVVHGDEIWSIRPPVAKRVFAARNGGVNAARFSPNGRWIVTASNDKTARLWDAKTFQVISPAFVHDGPVYYAEFASNARLIVTASFDNTAQLWRVDTGKRVGLPMRHSEWVYRARFNADATKVVTASADQTARIWDGQTGKPLTAPLEHEGRVFSAEFSPNGKKVLTVSDDSTARLWDSATGTWLATLRHGDILYSARFSPDGALIATASADGAARIWNAHSGLPASEALMHKGPVFSAVFSPDGKRVATASADETVRIWDTQSGLPASEPLKQNGSVYAARFSRDGTWLITASLGQLLTVWNSATPSSRPPSLLAPLAESICEMRFDGATRRDYSYTDYTIFRLTKDQLLASAENGWTRWAKWFLGDRETRTASPLFSITASQYISQRVGENTFASLEEAVRLSPTNAVALACLARKLIFSQSNNSIRDLTEAQVHLRRARKYGADDPQVKMIERETSSQIAEMQELAQSKAREDAAVNERKRQEETLKAVDHLLVEHPDDADLWKRKGALLVTRTDSDGALRAFSKMIELKPDDADGWDQRARIYQSQKRWRNAADDYAKVSQIYSNDYQCHRRYALLRLAAGDLEGYSRACFHLFEQTTAWNKYPVYEVVRTFAFGPKALPDINVTASLLENDLKTSTSRSDILDTFGAIEYRAGRFEEAQKSLIDSLKISNKSAFTSLFLAMAQARLQLHEQAKASLQEATSQLEDLQHRSNENQWDQLLELELLRKEAERTVTEANERKALKQPPVIAQLSLQMTNSIGLELVLFTNDLWVGKYEVTQAEYLKVMATNSSKYRTQPRLPIESVTWEEAKEFCRKLTDIEMAAGSLPPGFVYDLPTQVQWETFVADATFDLAITSQRSQRNSTQPVGSQTPNNRGLYDVLGNVWEWCHDGPVAHEKPYRGASFTSGPYVRFKPLAAATVRKAPPNYQYHDIGFRCVLIKAP